MKKFVLTVRNSERELVERIIPARNEREAKDRTNPEEEFVSVRHYESKSVQQMLQEQNQRRENILHSLFKGNARVHKKKPEKRSAFKAS